MPKLSTSSLGNDMFDAMNTYVKDYKDAREAALKLAVPPLERVDQVVFTGMGGSGIGASLVEGLVGPTAPRPIVVVKDYELPRWVGKRTLVVATSYSGNTEETLACVAAAHEKGAALVGVTSGGLMADFFAKKKLPLHRVPASRQPRAALPLLFGALGGMMERLGVASFALDGQDENILQNRHVQLQPKLSGTEDSALRIAESIRSRQPTIVGAGHTWPVAVRWKCQFNENSKMFARAEPLPEANHNDLVPWGEAPKQAVDALILLRTRKEPKPVATRFEFLTEVARREKVVLETVTSDCRTPLGQALELLMVGDYASVYAAILRRVDPTPVPIIGDLKKRLETMGAAGEVRKRLGL